MGSLRKWVRSAKALAGSRAMKGVLSGWAVRRARQPAAPKTGGKVGHGFCLFQNDVNAHPAWSVAPDGRLMAQRLEILDLSFHRELLA